MGFPLGILGYKVQFFTGSSLAFALLQSFIHFWITASMVTLMVSSALKDFALSALVQNYYTLISDAYTFSTPVFLFITR